MTERKRGFGVGFSKEVEAILGAVQLGAQLGEVYLYPWEVRENLRRAGMALDSKIPDGPVQFDWERHQPEFEQPEEDDYEEETDA